MSQAELLRLVVTVLSELRVDHMLVGSHASSFYGEPRSTHDVDLVIDLPVAKIKQLVSSFDPKRYYLSEIALREGRMANVIDLQSGDKVDCFILGSDPIDREAFSRRRLQNVMGVDVPLASAEDTILAKLKWSNMLGESTRQKADVREIFKYQRERLDIDYLRKQAAALGLVAELGEFVDGT